MNRVLDVWLDGRVVATLTQRRDLTLAYTYEAVDRYGVGGVALSLALPVDNRPYVGQRVERWVEGLLPEGEARTVLESRFSVRRGDVFGLISEIGADCAGAVSFIDPEREPRHDMTVEKLTDADVAALIDALPDMPLGANRGVPVSLAGLQHKLPLNRTAGGWAKPSWVLPSTHIIKPAPPGDMAGLIASEAFVLTLAAQAEMESAAARLDVIGDRTCLVITRYDRAQDPATGMVQRIHQEDGCQALGVSVMGNRKYEHSGSGVSYDRFARILNDQAVDARRELIALTNSMTLSVVVGNSDAHARNHSFLLSRGARLAPIYDAASTTVFSNYRGLGLHVAGEHRIDMVSRGHLESEAASWGIPRDEAVALVRSAIEQLMNALPAAVARVDANVERYAAEVKNRGERLLG